MRKRRNQFKSVIFATLLSTTLSLSSQAQTSLTPAQLTERTVERRAIEVANWGMPVVNFDRMAQAMLGAKRRLQPDRLLVGLFGLEEPDADAKSRHDPFQAVRRHQANRTDGA